MTQSVAIDEGAILEARGANGGPGRSPFLLIIQLVSQLHGRHHPIDLLKFF